MSIKHWLQSLNLDQYLSDFTRAGYTTLEQCSTLTDEKLQQIGLTLPGHKKRILGYLPTTENVQGADEDHLYGNVPLPSGASASSCIPKSSSSHTYVNTSSITSDPIYGNVSMPSDIKETDSTSTPRHSIIGDHGAKDDSESFYDVLPPPCQLRKKEESDGGEYVNIAAPPLEGAVGGIDMPPVLPPKKNKGNRRSVDEIMGIIPPTDDTLRRPVPKPRTTVGKGRPSLGSADSSPRNSIVDTKKDATPPILKPTPKPRPRPTPRGVKAQSRQDSASPCSSTSDSPRHSVNASPVSLPSPMHRDPSPDMPKEQAPVPPKPVENKTSEKMVRPLSIENVPSPEVPVKQEIRSPPKPPISSFKPQLSMETEVPPAEDQLPSQTCQRKIPLPLKCFHDNNNKTDSEKITSEVTSWKDNELYETADDTMKFANPGDPEKLDDFIKSLMPKASGSKTDSNSSPNAIQAEENESEELYQVPLPVIEIQTKKTTVSSTGTTTIKTSGTTSSPSLPNGTKKETPKSNDNKTSRANTNNKSPEPSNPPFSTFTTGWDKSRGQARDPPTKSSDRAAAPSGGDSSKSVGSVSSESDIDRDKHDSVYGAVWFATSGEAIHGKQQPELSVVGGQDVYEELDPEPRVNSRELHLSLKKKESELERASTTSSLDSSLSFNVPEPAFTPPPLPAGTQLENFTKAAIAQATSQNRPPPAIPPRPKNIPSVATRSTSERGSTSSLSSTGTSSSSNLLGLGGMSSPSTQRVSAMSFTNLAMERVDSSRGATGGNDDDSPEPFGNSQSRCPPAPPPRSTQPPLTDLFNHSGLSSAGFHDDMSDGVGMGSVWESDDTLSDGGEFYESTEFFKHHKPASTNDQIPVLPSTPSALQKDKEGVCYKYGSLKNRRGWQKRWVQFNGKTLKYFHDQKSPVSKRVIPVSSMVNVEQNIKHGEVHAFGFKVITVDRVYSFSVDDADELALWTCLLMKAIIDHDDKFIEGGQMSDPDLEGFVRMEGVKGKRYLAIKGDLMAYYNTYNDYKAGCPIHVIQMKLASVKNAGKNKLELRTPYATYGLHYDSNEELVNWKNAMEESITEGLAEDSVLNDVYENHSNRYCADCGSPDPHWASINLGVTICKHCAGIHRMLTMPFSKVRSLRMDVKVWTPTLIQLIKQLGNDNANNFWEWNSNEDNRIDSDSDINERRDYISSKYEEKMFCRLHPLHNDESAMNEALCKSVQYDDVFETMQLIFSGADILCTTNQYGGENDTPSQLARKAKQTTQMEFLYQNGAEGSGNFPATTSIRSGSDTGRRSPHLVKMKGYLLKTGPNQKDFHKRWCILEHGIFTYFENEKTLVAKDSILRHEMMSLAKVQDERQEFAFELGTTKAGGRVYLFAADHFDERQKWLVKIAKNFAPLPIEGLDQIRDLDRAGIVFLREGATTDWQTTWIQLKGRCLSIFNKENKVFEEIDLRKIIGIKSLNATDGDDMFQDKSPPFVIDLPKRALYIKGDAPRETKAWLEILEKITAESGGYLIEQQLTVEEVPVIVDKCINFISTHGMKVEGIYRKNGVHSKVSHLLQLFRANAREVHLRMDDYDVHDVGTTLKRYFRSLQEPLLTTFLYAKWTNTCNIGDFGAKMQWYKYLLGELPTVHYSTLKRVISHLARLTDYQDENKMTKINLASIFGPVLMNPDKDDGGEHNTTAGFGATQQEINVVLDLLDNNIWLFEVKDDELEHERKMQEAMEKIQRANEFRQSQAGELLMGVYINTKEGDAVTLKVPANMTGEDLLEYVVGKAILNRDIFWGLYEVVGQGQLERPIHFLEKVLDVTLRWTEWPEEFCRDNHLLVKPNYVYENVDNVFDPHFSLFEELKYSDKKSFKKYCFEFSQFKLTYQKDPRATTPINSWNVEDLIMYVGVDQKRSPPTKNALTFILHKEKITKNKDTPYFGHSLCFNTPEDQYRWLAAMLHAQHPGGLTRDGPPTATSAHGLDAQIPSPHLDNRQGVLSRTKLKTSFITRLIKR